MAIDFYNIDLNDDKTWLLLQQGQTKSVFQLDGQLGQDWSKRLKPENLEHLSALTSIIRPSCLNGRTENGKSIAQQYVDRKNGEEESRPYHPALANVLDKTCQCMLYQEDAMAIAKEIAGFNLVEADELRKAIGKKKLEIMQKVEKKFLDGCKKVGKVNEEEAKFIFEWIRAGQKYSFNKCLHPDTLVQVLSFTDVETIKLKEVKVGDFVASPGFGEDLFTKVVAVYDNGSKPVSKFSTECGLYIMCTNDHKVLCEDGIQRPIQTAYLQGKKIKCRNSKKKFTELVGIEDLGWKQTLDIEVEHPSHLFYANGLAVSNSHGISYGLVAYWTAYAKAYNPAAWLCASLNYPGSIPSEQHNIRELILEAKSLGIQVAPPNLKSEYDKFSLKDGVIHFGLTAVKNVGESGIKKFKDMLDEENIDLASLSWMDTLPILDKTNKRIVEALIGVGYFDYISLKRQELLHDYQVYTKIPDSVKKYMDGLSSCCSLKEYLQKAIDEYDSAEQLKLVDKSAKKPFTVTVYKKLVSWKKLVDEHVPSMDPTDWISKYEREFLGIDLTCTRLDNAGNFSSNTTCANIKKGIGERENVAISVEIDSTRPYKITRGSHEGRTMCFLTLRDNSGIADGLMFADTYEKYVNFVYPQNTVILFGKIGDKGSLIIEKMEEI